MDNNLKLIECDLCGMQFSKNDYELVIRLNRHTDWHKYARIQKRNTTNGIPNYKEVKA